MTGTAARAYERSPEVESMYPGMGPVGVEHAGGNRRIESVATQNTDARVHEEDREARWAVQDDLKRSTCRNMPIEGERTRKGNRARMMVYG